MKANSYSHFKRNWFCIFWIIALLITVFGLLYKYEKDKKLRFVEQMGYGINLGNALDATNLRDYRPDAATLEYETFWGNPKIQQENFAAIYDAGFRTVRIPVTFEEHLDEEFRISAVWMNRVEQVIQMALAEKLYVIMDLHGDEWLDLELSQREEIKRNFETVWLQIATRFRDYDEHLLLEGMNEPRLRDSEYEWTEGTAELRAFVNELNQSFVDTIRGTGGGNEERYLLICPYVNGPRKETVEDLIVPDGNIIIAVHMYRPYGFCQNREGSAEWSREVYEDTFESEEAFLLMYERFVQKHIPVIFTEYGCVDKNNLEARKEWARFYMSLSHQYKIPCIWWDNGSTYQLLDREENTWIYPELVDIISK